MSTASRLTTSSNWTEDRIDRVLALIERLVIDGSGVRVRLHSFVITIALGVSLFTAPTVGVTPSITADARIWAIGAVLVATLQAFSLVVESERLRAVAGVTDAMLFFAFAFQTLHDAPTSFVAYGFLSLGFWCLLPTLQPLFHR